MISVRIKKSKLCFSDNGKSSEIDIPPSKSHSLRALILAAFADSPSEIENILMSGDIETAVSVLQTFGVKTEIYKNDSGIFTAKVVPPKNGIKEFILKSKNRPLIIDAGNSGSVFYFLGAAFTALPVSFIFTGDVSLCKRPAAPLIEIYNALGINYEFLVSENYAPITVTGKNLNSFQTCSLSGNFSQPISGLLFSAALRNGGLAVNLKTAGELPYLRMTVEWLKRCGIQCRHSRNFKKFKFDGGQKLQAVKTVIPGDWSSAAFPIAAAIASNSELKLKNLDITDVQGDREIVSILRQMNTPMHYDKNDKSLTVFPHNGKLTGGEFDLSDMPDAVPALSAIACFAKGKTVLKNIGICRFKECDRIAAVCSELGKFGADVTSESDFLIIQGKGGDGLHCGETYSYGDHRIAMMSIAMSLGLTCRKTSGFTGEDFSVIRDTECIDVTYPLFIEDLKKCGASLDVIAH